MLGFRKCLNRTMSSSSMTPFPSRSHPSRLQLGRSTTTWPIVASMTSALWSWEAQLGATPYLLNLAGLCGLWHPSQVQ